MGKLGNNPLSFAQNTITFAKGCNNMSEKKNGRIPILTKNPKIKQRICEAIAKGSSYKMAAAYAGISVGTFYHWMSHGREASEDNKNQNDYVDFYNSVMQAKANCMLTHLENIDRAAEAGSWQASAWKLERVYGMTAKEKPDVEINVTVDAIDTGALIKQLKKTDEIIKLTGPIIDLDED